MNIGIICIRKRWNNAPSFLIEGLKEGIFLLKEKNFTFKDTKFTFCPFTIHNPEKIYISPESVKHFDCIIIPFWISKLLFEINLKQIKDMGIKVYSYTGISPYQTPYFKIDFPNILQDQLKDHEWQNYLAIDKFFVVHKTFPQEVEIGCGQTERYYSLDKKENILLDFCKKNWDEFIWEDFNSSWKGNNLIQLGEYPFRIKNSGIFTRDFVHFRRMCKLYSSTRIFISMNESFGYPIIENKFAGNIVLVHEKAQLPSFHLKSNYIYYWNKDNLMDIIKTIANPLDIRKDFINTYQNQYDWSKTIENIIDEVRRNNNL